MKGFNFRLQPILNVKRQIEGQKEIEYGKALQQLEEEKQRKIRLLDQQTEQIADFRKSLHTNVSPPDIRRYNNTLEKLKQMIAEQEKKIEAAEVFAERKRTELVEAMKQRKMLDTIKDKRLDDYIVSEKIQEQKHTDELISYRYA